METPRPMAPRSSHPYLLGLITGASLAVAAFSMMGQGYSKPGTGGSPAGPATKEPSPTAPAPAVEADTYFVTAGNASNTTARLWKRPGGKSTLEYMGEYQSAGKSQR